jgi:dihydrofolate reductase
VRRIVNSTYISLDGVIESPQNWPSGRHEDDGRALELQTELVEGSEVLLMGRRTYEGFAPAWSARSGDPLSDRFNSMEKWVASTTLTAPDWHNTAVLGGDAVVDIRTRKEEPGGDIVQFGFGELSYALMEQDLIDELRFWIHPFFVGEAATRDLLFRPARQTVFDLAETTTLASGIAVLTYRR